MPTLSLRNAYYRGWFAARDRRRPPTPIMLEERFFIDVGFIEGERSTGSPLRLWNKDIAPGTPANLESMMQSDEPIFSTRRSHSAFPPSAMRPARKSPAAEYNEPHQAMADESSRISHTAIESDSIRSAPAQKSSAATSDEETSESEESDPAEREEPALRMFAEKSPARLPEKKPQFNLPRRSYGGGPSVKRRSVKR